MPKRRDALQRIYADPDFRAEIRRAEAFKRHYPAIHAGEMAALRRQKRRQRRVKMVYLLAVVSIAVFVAWVLTSCAPTPRPVQAGPILAVLTKTATAVPSPTETATATASPAAMPTPFYCRVETGGEVLNFRLCPGMDCEVLGGIANHDMLKVTGTQHGWYLVEAGYIAGWVSGEYCEVTE